MRYYLSTKGQKEPTPVELESVGPGRYRVKLEGAVHEVDALLVEPGTLSLILEGRSYTAELDEQQEALLARVRAHAERVEVLDERRYRLRAASTHFAIEGKQVICAPMPGKVVKLLVKLGDAVLEGQGLVVVEAMKMENELKSPKAGKVTELFVAEGGTVENNAKLLSVE